MTSRNNMLRAVGASSLHEHTACPVCGVPAYRAKHRHQHYQFGDCENCGLAYVRPFEKGDVEAVGAADSSVTDPGYLDMMCVQAVQREQTAMRIAKRRMTAYRGILGRPIETVCEIGAGDGAFSSAYEGLGVSYTGFEINEKLASLAASLGHNVRLGAAPQAFGNSAGRFDVVFASQVLEHVLEPRPFLATARDLMRADGLLHLDVPNEDGVSARLRRIIPRPGQFGFLQVPHHQIAYSQRTLSQLLDICGFDVEWAAAKGNFDLTWGQLTVGPSVVKRAALLASGWIGGGSLLVAIARKRLAVEPRAQQELSVPYP